MPWEIIHKDQEGALYAKIQGEDDRVFLAIGERVVISQKREGVALPSQAVVLAFSDIEFIYNAMHKFKDRSLK